MITRWVGTMIVLVIFGLLFWLSAQATDWRFAIRVWATAIAIVVVLVAGTYLLAGPPL